MNRPQLREIVNRSRASAVIWPLAGILNYVGYRVAQLIFPRLPDVSVAMMIVPFVLWGALSPLITAISLHVRPGVVRARRVVVAHVAVFGICFVVQTLLRPETPLREALANPGLLLRNVILGAAVYATIVCTVWTRLLLDEIARVTTAEMTALDASTSGVLRRLSLPGRYFRGLLRSIGEDLEREPSLGEQSTLRIARLLRRQLDGSRIGSWPLLQEIDLLDDYLDLEKSRGVTSRLLVHIDRDLQTRTVFPGAITVEVASFVESNAGDGELVLSIHHAADGLTGRIESKSAAHSFRIEQPLTALTPSESQLTRFAAGITRHARPIAVLMVMTFWVLVTMATALTLHNGDLLLRPMFFAAIRAALPFAFVLAVVQGLDAARPVGSFRFFGLVFAAAMAGHWWHEIFLGLFYRNPPWLVVQVSTAVTLSSVAIPYIAVAAVAVTVYMIRVGGEATRRNEQAFVVLQRLREAQARFLQWQTNPHFLFNALNAMARLIRSDRVAAKEFLKRLTSFYEEAVRIEKDTHTLGEELDLLSRYFAIERVRFGTAIAFAADVPPHLRAVAVPALILQPLVENATKHGTTIGGSLAICLEARSSDGRLTVTLTNPASAAPPAGQGSGLRITQERLAAVYGTAATLRTEADDRSFTAALEIPFTPAA